MCVSSGFLGSLVTEIALGICSIWNQDVQKHSRTIGNLFSFSLMSSSSLPLSPWHCLGGERALLSLRLFFSLEDLFERAASEQRFPGRIKVQEQKASEGCFTAEAAVAYLLSE